MVNKENLSSESVFIKLLKKSIGKKIIKVSLGGVAGSHWLRQHLSDSCMESPLTEASEHSPRGTWDLAWKKKGGGE